MDDPAAAMTLGQQRIYDEVVAAGQRVYNGRAAAPIKTLEQLGLVVADWEWVPQARGNGMGLVQRITVRPAPGPGDADPGDADPPNL